MLLSLTCPHCSAPFTHQTRPESTPFLRSGAVRLTYDFLRAGHSLGLLPAAPYLLNDLAQGISAYYRCPSWHVQMSSMIWPALGQQSLPRGRKGNLLQFDPDTLPAELSPDHDGPAPIPAPPSLDNPESLSFFPYPLRSLSDRPSTDYDLTLSHTFDPPVVSRVSVESRYYRYWPYENSAYPPGEYSVRSWPNPIRASTASMSRSAAQLSVNLRGRSSVPSSTEPRKPGPVSPKVVDEFIRTGEQRLRPDPGIDF